MSVKTALSTKSTAEEACAELRAQLASFEPRVVLFFASSAFEPAAIARGMKAAFESAEVFGCTTAGEIVSGKMLKQSVVAMAISAEVIADVAVEVVQAIKTENNVPAAMDSLGGHYGTTMAALDVEQHVGLVLIDGLSGAEERIMDAIGNLTDVAFVGASAGDDLAFETTHVFANGVAYTNAAVLAVARVPAGFDIIKTQSFRPTGKRLVATEVDEAARTVVSFDGKPAASAYAEALGVTAEDAPNHFMHSPVGLMVGDEPYVRSPQRLSDDKIVFYCNIRQGTELSILESSDIVADTKRAVDAKIAELGGVQGIIDFHCILRTLELEDIGAKDDYGRIFTDVPAIGFSTYGEEYIGHINQTSTMLVWR